MKYTREQILAMDAEQLRLAIAEAKGWVRKFGRMDKASGRDHEYFLKPDGTLAMYPPDWPTDISAAWELLTEIIGWQMWHNGHRYKVLTPHNLSASGDTVPLAICRAYLLWKEGV